MEKDRMASNSKKEMNKRLIPVFLFFLLIIPIASGTQSMPKTLTDKMKSLLDPEWEKLKPNPVPRTNEPPKKWWMYYISPPFPSGWPPNPNLTLYYYIYAQGHDFSRGLVDAVYIGAPWARVEVDVKREISPKFKLLSNKIKEIGIQGVRPINQEEAVVFGRAESVEAFLGNLAALPDEKDNSVSELRKYYCSWLKVNGVIAPEIRSSHRAFFKWLHCE